MKLPPARLACGYTVDESTALDKRNDDRPEILLIRACVCWVEGTGSLINTG